MRRVIVLQAGADEDSDPRAAQALLERLPYARRLELDRRDAQSRRASLLAIDLVLRGASGLLGREVSVGELRFPQGGKPWCCDGPFFSVSHTARRVAVALSVDCELGIDLEDVPSGAGPGGDALARLERWTATEAALKAAGLGLRDVQRVELDAGCATATCQGATYFLRPLRLGPDVVASLATAAPPESVVVY
jgi:phosphopantetheinyl transferase